MAKSRQIRPLQSSTVIGRLRSLTKTTTQPLTDLSAYPVLTEEVGFPPSPLARPSGAPGAVPGTAPLGQIVAKAVSDVLGWKVKSADPKGFVGALTQAFTLTEVEGHIESKWMPRTYAVQTDLAGGITGAQASVYSRAKEAVDKSLPLLDGLYSLDPEADPEDVTALKAIAKNQLTQLASEIGVVPPRISRVNQYFNLLLGSTFPSAPLANYQLTQTDPDQIRGTLGNLRDELGLNFTNQDFVNSIGDETNLSNFRIISDYVTSLAQSWLNNLGFLVLDTDKPFFGTQLVLLSRQLSVVAESVDEVRFTLDSVFLGPAERQTMELNYTTGEPSIFLEDLLNWIQSFATEEGPRLIQEGGKFGVRNTFLPVAQQLLNLVGRIPLTVPPVKPLPPGFYTARVTLSIGNLVDQLTELVNLATPIEHVITPEPEFALSVLAAKPEFWLISAGRPLPLNLTIVGTGFLATKIGDAPVVTISPSGGLTYGVLAFSEKRIVVEISGISPAAIGPHDITVTNIDGTSVTLGGGFTVSP